MVLQWKSSRPSQIGWISDAKYWQAPRFRFSCHPRIYPALNLKVCPINASIIQRFSVHALLASSTPRDELMMTSDGWLTLDEFAAYLKLSHSKPYWMVRQKTVLPSKVGFQWRVARHEIDASMKIQSQGANDSPGNDSADGIGGEK